MLATFGLDRLEAGLQDDTVSPQDVNAYLEQAKAECAKTAPRTELAYAYATVDARYDEHVLPHSMDTSAAGLPRRVFIPHETNPEFQPTRQPHRV